MKASGYYRNDGSEVRSRRQRGVCRLGDCVQEYLERHAQPAVQRGAGIADAWESIVGPELAAYCRADALDGRQLKVLVDSPSHIYELRLREGEIIERLRELCPAAKVRRIRFTAAARRQTTSRRS